jgi:hypothetical protein
MFNFYIFVNQRFKKKLLQGHPHLETSSHAWMCHQANGSTNANEGIEGLLKKHNFPMTNVREDYLLTMGP